MSGSKKKKRLRAEDPNTDPETLAGLANDPELAPYVAANPSAPPEVLDRLARDERSAVREAVAGNPNTTDATLDVLSWDSSDEVLSSVSANPRTSKAVRNRLRDAVERAAWARRTSE